MLSWYLINRGGPGIWGGNCCCVCKHTDISLYDESAADLLAESQAIANMHVLCHFFGLTPEESQCPKWAFLIVDQILVKFCIVVCFQEFLQTKKISLKTHE